ncbi:MIND kinetochore complex component Mtw1, putative [Cordyceps militaris CM01]|uniref:MIND kinetochore complex component Mtw1, putative n=1 Tax=Cordyceps militaris (strain CM01) TaxID=983644 RepID=G3J659_CORMM|nr:MIND kinetochore complex component Mtw1, putative [Cordyceps militaris CM01]EGX96958.1 MIND kinetochore complex component Mtw1, putative [Cordyceps militaris CM01]
MSAPDNAEYELLTEHFSYPPVSLLDDIINAVNVLADRAVGAVETALTGLNPHSIGFGPSKKRGAPGTAPPADTNGGSSADPAAAAKREIEQGTHQLETLLNASIDKNFDIFELYVMRNILTVKPDDQPYMTLAHYRGLDFAPSTADAPASLESVTQLRRRLHASQALQVALETERVRNEALLQTLRAAVGVKSTTTTTAVKTEDGAAAAPQQQQTNVLGFLHDRGTLEEGGTERPIATTTEFTLAQLDTLRSLSSTLRALLPDMAAEEEEEEQEHKEKSWRRERAEYVESASRQYLETVAGVELGPAGEVRDGEWQGPGRGMAREELDGLETVVAVLGAQQPPEDDEPAAAGDDEDESMVQS